MTKKERIAAIRSTYQNRLKRMRDNDLINGDVAAGLACLVVVTLDNLKKADARRKGFKNYLYSQVETLEKAFNECSN